MPYVNVVASDNGADFKTKKALKDAINTRPQDVRLIGTSSFTPFKGGLADLVPGITYSVKGPTPYLAKWYANIETMNGKIKFS